jgi:hypothetical protein
MQDIQNSLFQLLGLHRQIKARVELSKKFKNLLEHADHVRRVFEVLKENNLVLNKKKCDLAVDYRIFGACSDC